LLSQELFLTHRTGKPLRGSRNQIASRLQAYWLTCWGLRPKKKKELKQQIPKRNKPKVKKNFKKVKKNNKSKK